MSDFETFEVLAITNEEKGDAIVGLSDLVFMQLDPGLSRCPPL